MSPSILTLPMRTMRNALTLTGTRSQNAIARIVIGFWPTWAMTCGRRKAWGHCYYQPILSKCGLSPSRCKRRPCAAPRPKWICCSWRNITTPVRLFRYHRKWLHSKVDTPRASKRGYSNRCCTLTWPRSIQACWSTLVATRAMIRWGCLSRCCKNYANIG